METGKHTIVVTGAASGIGRSIAHRFASRSWGVVLVDINSERGRMEEKELLERDIQSCSWKPTSLMSTRSRC